MPSAWTHCTFGDTASAARELRSALSAAGVELVPPGPQVPGILVFDDPRPACDVLAARGAHAAQVLAVASGELRVDATWQLLASGASDVIAARREVALEIRARLDRWEMVDRIIAAPVVRDNLVGHSPTWLAVVRQLVEVAAFSDASVLILGESGSGKELAARLIHTLDQKRNGRDLVVLDCGTIVPDLAGSEFFGHERGSFTGAAGPREGAFALADGGTLFLDEVGELPASLQPQLLRVVQERTYKRVGGNAWNKTDFRLVCATNRDLDAEVQSGRFRRDLYHRITSWVVRLPPLRERPEDVLCLARHFLADFLPVAPDIDSAVQEYLLKREYPGNVRDLRQVIFRLSQRHAGPGPITAGDIPLDERPAASGLGDWNDAPLREAVRRALGQGVGLKEIGRRATDAAVRLVLDQEEGNVQRAARRLGVTDRAVQLRRAPRRAERDGTSEVG